MDNQMPSNHCHIRRESSNCSVHHSSSPSTPWHPKHSTWLQQGPTNPLPAHRLGEDLLRHGSRLRPIPSSSHARTPASMQLDARGGNIICRGPACGTNHPHGIGEERGHQPRDIWHRRKGPGHSVLREHRQAHGCRLRRLHRLSQRGSTAIN